MRPAARQQLGMSEKLQTLLVFSAIFIALGAVMYSLLSADRRDRERLGNPRERFEPYLQTYLALYRTLVPDDGQLPDGRFWSQGEFDNFHGKVAFFTYQETNDKQSPFLRYVFVTAAMRREAEEVREGITDMFAWSPDETDVIVVLPIPHDSTTPFPVRTKLAVIDIQAERLLGARRLIGPKGRVLSPPKPGGDVRGPDDTRWSQLAQDRVGWQDILRATLGITRWSSDLHVFDKERRDRARARAPMGLLNGAAKG